MRGSSFISYFYDVCEGRDVDFGHILSPDRRKNKVLEQYSRIIASFLGECGLILDERWVVVKPGVGFKMSCVFVIYIDIYRENIYIYIYLRETI